VRSFCLICSLLAIPGHVDFLRAQNTREAQAIRAVLDNRSSTGIAAIWNPSRLVIRFLRKFL